MTRIASALEKPTTWPRGAFGRSQVSVTGLEPALHQRVDALTQRKARVLGEHARQARIADAPQLGDRVFNRQLGGAFDQHAAILVRPWQFSTLRGWRADLPRFATCLTRAYRGHRSCRHGWP